MNQEKPNYYSILTADIRYDKRLKRHADCKVLYSEITALANRSGYCHAKNSYFAELYDRPKETISKWINLLRDCGYLKIKMIYKEGTKQIIERRIYPVSTPINADEGIDADVKTYSREQEGGIDADVKTPINVNVKDNITSINNTSMNSSSNSASAKQAISQYWQKEFKTVTNGVIEQHISDWVDEFGYELVKHYLDYIFEKQIDRSHAVSYLNKIFNGCREKGITTLDGAMKAEKKHAEKSNAGHTNKHKKVERIGTKNTDYSAMGSFQVKTDGPTLDEELAALGLGGA